MRVASSHTMDAGFAPTRGHWIHASSAMASAIHAGACDIATAAPASPPNANTQARGTQEASASIRGGGEDFTDGGIQLRIGWRIMAE